MLTIKGDKLEKKGRKVMETCKSISCKTLTDIFERKSYLDKCIAPAMGLPLQLSKQIPAPVSQHCNIITMMIGTM